MVSIDTVLMLRRLIERCEEAAMMLETNAGSSGRAALRLRQGVAEARFALGTSRAPKPVTRLGEASRG